MDEIERQLVEKITPDVIKTLNDVYEKGVADGKTHMKQLVVQCIKESMDCVDNDDVDDLIKRINALL